MIEITRTFESTPALSDIEQENSNFNVYVDGEQSTGVALSGRALYPAGHTANKMPLALDFHGTSLKDSRAFQHSLQEFQKACSRYGQIVAMSVTTVDFFPRIQVMHVWNASEQNGQTDRLAFKTELYCQDRHRDLKWDYPFTVNQYFNVLSRFVKALVPVPGHEGAPVTDVYLHVEDTITSTTPLSLVFETLDRSLQNAHAQTLDAIRKGELSKPSEKNDNSDSIRAWIVEKYSENIDPKTGIAPTRDVKIDVGYQLGSSVIPNVGAYELIALLTIEENGVLEEQQIMLTRDQAAELGARLVQVANIDPVM